MSQLRKDIGFLGALAAVFWLILVFFLVPLLLKRRSK